MISVIKQVIKRSVFEKLHGLQGYAFFAHKLFKKFLKLYVQMTYAGTTPITMQSLVAKYLL